MHLGPEVVHRIVATAFHGQSPSDNHIVDHIDTNRRNNRADNLRWITRLENILLNPVTCRRIEIAYGSLEAFFKNPRAPLNPECLGKFAWMRTVSKEEALQSRERLQCWGLSNAPLRGGSLGEWIFSGAAVVRRDGERDTSSRTPNAVQRNWRTPASFDLCPKTCSPDALFDYLRRLTSGAVFASHIYGEPLVVVAEQGTDFISVLCNLPNNPVKGWAVTKVSIESGLFVHESVGTYFSFEGAQKSHSILLNRPFDKETIDDFL